MKFPNNAARPLAAPSISRDTRAPPSPPGASPARSREASPRRLPSRDLHSRGRQQQPRIEYRIRALLTLCDTVQRRARDDRPSPGRPGRPLASRCWSGRWSGFSRVPGSRTWKMQLASCQKRRAFQDRLSCLSNATRNANGAPPPPVYRHANSSVLRVLSRHCALAKTTWS